VPSQRSLGGGSLRLTPPRGGAVPRRQPRTAGGATAAPCFPKASMLLPPPKLMRHSTIPAGTNHRRAAHFRARPRHRHLRRQVSPPSHSNRISNDNRTRRRRTCKVTALQTMRRASCYFLGRSWTSLESQTIEKRWLYRCRAMPRIPLTNCESSIDIFCSIPVAACVRVATIASNTLLRKPKSSRAGARTHTQLMRLVNGAITHETPSNSVAGPGLFKKGRVVSAAKRSAACSPLNSTAAAARLHAPGADGKRWPRLRMAMGPVTS